MGEQPWVSRVATATSSENNTPDSTPSTNSSANWTLRPRELVSPPTTKPLCVRPASSRTRLVSDRLDDRREAPRSSPNGCPTRAWLARLRAANPPAPARGRRCPRRRSTSPPKRARPGTRDRSHRSPDPLSQPSARRRFGGAGSRLSSVKLSAKESVAYTKPRLALRTPGPHCVEQASAARRQLVAAAWP